MRILSLLIIIRLLTPPVVHFDSLSCEYRQEFSKKLETALMRYGTQGLWGKLIHEKKPEV
jgi:hypothetical protein